MLYIKRIPSSHEYFVYKKIKLKLQRCKYLRDIGRVMLGVNIIYNIFFKSKNGINCHCDKFCISNFNGKKEVF